MDSRALDPSRKELQRKERAMDLWGVWSLQKFEAKVLIALKKIFSEHPPGSILPAL